MKMIRSIVNRFTVATILGATLLTGCAGCSSTRGVRYPLQPGEKIVFESGERAAEFRRITGTEYNPLNVRTGRVVTVEGVLILEAH